MGRRTKGDGGLYQRADGVWVGVVELGWDAKGNRKRKTVSSRDHATALRKLRDLRASVERGVVPSNATVAQWLSAWLDSEPVAKLRPRTIGAYRTYVDNHLVPHLGKIRLDRLQPSDVERMLRAMSDQGLGVGTRRQARAVLQSALKVALREERVARNVAALATPPSGTTRHHAHLELDDARKVVAELTRRGTEGEWDSASRFLVALLAGLRQGEALGLEWSHVHLDAEEPWLDVQQAAQRVAGRGLVIADVKSASSHRSVPLVAPVAVALRAHREQTGGRGYVWGGDSLRDPRRDWRAWKEVLAAAGAPDVPLHGARATTASLLFAGGVSDLTVSRILGHSQVQVTRDAYLRTNRAQYADALEQGLKALLG